MSAVQTGDVFIAEDEAMFVVISTAHGGDIRYKLIALGAEGPGAWSGSTFVAVGDRDTFDPCLTTYAQGQRYLGHRDCVGRLQGVDL